MRKDAIAFFNKVFDDDQEVEKINAKTQTEKIILAALQCYYDGYREVEDDEKEVLTELVKVSAFAAMILDALCYGGSTSASGMNKLAKSLATRTLKGEGRKE